MSPKLRFEIRLTALPPGPLYTTPVPGAATSRLGFSGFSATEPTTSQLVFGPFHASSPDRSIQPPSVPESGAGAEAEQTKKRMAEAVSARRAHRVKGGLIAGRSQ